MIQAALQNAASLRQRVAEERGLSGIALTAGAVKRKKEKAQQAASRSLNQLLLDDHI